MKFMKEVQLRAATLLEIQKLFSKEYQSEHHPERTYIGQSWVTNFHEVYVNSNLDVDSFVESVTNSEAWTLKTCDSDEYSSVWDEFWSLDQLISGAMCIFHFMTHEQVGILIESRLFNE